MRQGPLKGIKVLDLTSFVSGPFCCSLLADLGADIIKIEPPGGESQREYPSTVEAESRVFLGINRGKRAIVLNLKSDGGRDVFLRLAAKADVIVENFRPGVMERLGISYETVRTNNRGLIYCAIRGYGDGGPLRDKPGYDQVVQTMSGIAALQGTEGAPQLVRGAFIDFYTSTMAMSAILAALFNRTKTGAGQYVSTSLLASALALQAGRFVWTDDEAREIDRDLQPGRIAGIHPTKEGGLYLSAHTARFWSKLSEKIGLPELATDPKFDTSKKRADHADELLPKLHAALKAHTAQEWVDILGDEVPCAAVGTIEDMFDHPQVLASNLVGHYPHPRIGGYRALASPFQFSETPLAATTAAPLLGQHTDEILGEYGWSAGEITHLRNSGDVA